MNKVATPSDPVADVNEDLKKCPRCGAWRQLDQDTCINCFLRAGIEGKGEGSRETFESILLEANVSDTPWRLGHYEILEEIGRGGMGVIYRARQQHSRRTVAVKRVLAHQVNSHETLERFRREAEAVASLDHPNILPIYEVSESEDGLPYFSMKYATGGSLRTAAPALRKNPRECVRLMAKVARAIDYAHGKGILHRDLQPGNILLDENGEPMVSDFGLAKWLDQSSDLTRTLETLGTPGYIAPEQAEYRAADLTSAADIYSLGAILFYLLAGRPPFVGPNVLHVIHKAAATPAPPLRSLVPSLDRDLETIVGRCLEPDPKARYQTAGALADDLEHWLQHEPIRAKHVGPFTRGRKWVRRNPSTTVLVTLLVALAVGMSVMIWDRELPRPLPQGSVGIAVLPFENVSGDAESAAFTDGVQHEILNDLAKIADLKVIGRTSVMQYKSGGERNLRQIANELGVTHVVEGSVLRTANRVRISAQLIEAKTGRSIWMRNYDRTLADSVTLEGDLATEIATAVGTTLGPQEKALVTAAPTNNATAYDAYLSGRVFASEDQTESALRSYQKAVELDPSFALAWAGLSSMQSLAHWELDSSPERVSAAKAAIDRALAFNPNLPEVHLASGYYRYYVLRDFSGALSELRQAEQALPNDTDVIKTIAFVQRRLGQWDEALAGLRRVVELDPRDIDAYTNLALTYEALRRFPEALTTFERALSWEPVKVDSEAAWKSLTGSNGAWKGLLLMKADTLWATGNLQSSKLPYESAYTIGFMRAGQALLQRRYAEAEEILSQALADKSIAAYSTDVFENREILLLILGLTQQRAGDIATARATYQQVVRNSRHTLETVSPGSSAETQARVNLAWAYAGLGEADSAIEEGRKAIAIMPSSKDAYRGPKYEENMARIYALLGDADHAVPILERLLHMSYLAPLTPAKLRTDPTLDQIRNDPRFQKLAAEK
jgi:TolB-like protein/tetratricopeptide (TPR) repeat protein/tRNA A-37 threonylcarbamoyl transferase component Bud32